MTIGTKNRGIASASNSALAQASGSHAALVDHDDLLSRDAFLAAYKAWQHAPATQLFYTDECIARPDGSFALIWPKPDWSPAYLENTMCVGHLSIYRTDFLRSLGGFRSEYDGTQDYDLALRASRTEPKVVHLPIFGYIWRAVPGSAAGDTNAKQYAIGRQREALLDYARTRHPEATVKAGWNEGFWRIVYPLPQPVPLLSYVIPTKGNSRMIGGVIKDLVLNCVRSFEAKQFYPNREYIIVHNGDLTPTQQRELSTIGDVKLVEYTSKTFNFSEIVNRGVAAARGTYICLLNDDIEAITPRGGEELISYLAVNQSVGAIGPLCLREDNTIQQNGVVLLNIGPAHAGDGGNRDSDGYFGLLRCRREAFGIGGAVLFTKKEIYEILGGFAEDLPPNYSDVDFCVRLRKFGYTCVMDPDIHVYNFEGATKIGTNALGQELFLSKHPGLRDPYFSKWFDRRDPNYHLNLVIPREISFREWLRRHIARRSWKRSK